MKTDIRIFAKKSLFGNYQHVGFLNLLIDDILNFNVPSKGDIITIPDDLIRVWNSEYTNVPLKVQYVQYNYGYDKDGETVCDIIIFVKK